MAPDFTGLLAPSLAGEMGRKYVIAMATLDARFLSPTGTCSDFRARSNGPELCPMLSRSGGAAILTLRFHTNDGVLACCSDDSCVRDRADILRAVLPNVLRTALPGLVRRTDTSVLRSVHLCVRRFSLCSGVGMPYRL